MNFLFRLNWIKGKVILAFRRDSSFGSVRCAQGALHKKKFEILKDIHPIASCRWMVGEMVRESPMRNLFAGTGAFKLKVSIGKKPKNAEAY